MRTRKTVARAVATGACAVSLVAALQGQAWAATVSIEASGGGGSAQFNGDTNTFRACDTAADGWGIEARLRFPAADNKPDLVVDTRGHAATYCTPGKAASPRVSRTACSSRRWWETLEVSRYTSTSAPDACVKRPVRR